jgi:hypothetical protein
VRVTARSCRARGGAKVQTSRALTPRSDAIGAVNSTTTAQRKDASTQASATRVAVAGEARKRSYFIAAQPTPTGDGAPKRARITRVDPLSGIVTTYR